ncbi:MAG: T9SS type A sorting domain-containing protein [Chitinophagaceae bacterium]|nr:T9SS type A sorting domain-containing protein [Chitinophagaceae bacterium]
MKTFTIKLFLLWGLIFSSLQGTAQNVLADGSFTTTAVITPYYTGTPPSGIWCSWLNTGTVASPSVSGGVCTYAIANAGFQTWEVQLIQWGFPLIPGDRYRLTFDVRADANRNFGVYIGENEGLWTNLNAANYLQQATTSWQTKTIEFNVTAAFTFHKLSFEMGSEITNMYFDNIMLQNIGPAPFPVIEIIGSSVPPYDWSSGQAMQTTDGINYTLTGYTLPAGEAKFRQDYNWGINWGASSFPAGAGYQNGPNIPVTAGTYNISFNRLSGVYNFSCVTCPASIGIIGSAVPPYNWSSDVNMATTDGINYSLNDYYIKDGELRFRQDDDWIINWGGTSFPSGTGSIYAPNIQVTAGNYNISFNRLTGEYNFQIHLPGIGIIGTAVNGGWSEDVDLQTTDGVTYTLSNYHLMNGEAKFRQDNSWNINWGNYTFPTGIGYGGGPNIPITEGTYNITFNRVTGEYAFVCTGLDIECNSDTVLNAATGLCGAEVWYRLPVVKGACGYYYVIQTSGLPRGSFFPVGMTVNTFVAYMPSGATATCSFSVTIKDQQPPDITGLNASPSSLWPANHKMKNVSVNYDTWDNCGIVSSTLAVSSNEPVNGTGDGDTAPDWSITDNHHVMLRAERSGTGDGRIYTITITGTDASGNTSVKTTRVVVPHNQNGTNSNTGSKEAASAGEEYTGMLLDVSIDPNPATDYFNLHIRSVSTEKIEVKLFDISGRLISGMTGTNNQTIRFGKDLLPGVYIAEIRQGQQRKTIKVVKH